MISRLALDTNAYRALDDGNSSLETTLKSTPNIGIPVTVLGELYFGIYLGTRSSQNISRLNRFLSSPRITVLTITHHTAKLFGEIAAELRRSDCPVQQNDMWIAALCKQYEYTLATADQGFEAITGLEIVGF